MRVYLKAALEKAHVCIHCANHCLQKAVTLAGVHFSQLARQIKSGLLRLHLYEQYACSMSVHVLHRAVPDTGMAAST